MNDRGDEFSDDVDDRTTEDLLSCLKQIELPMETRLANRAAIAAELFRLASVTSGRRLPWWKRTIAVPVPLVLGMALLIAAAFLFPWVQRREPAVAVAGSHDTRSRAVRPDPVKPERHPDVTDVTDELPVLEYYETETYLCGIGQLTSRSGYLIKE
jgi:hypothetical protein